MRYDHLTMLPERAFQRIAGRMTFEGGGGGKSSKQAPPPPPPPPPQAAKAPDADIIRSKNKQAMSGGMDGGTNTTVLTGPGGVDPNALETSKTTLLGG
jgi:hypothetical protein